MKEFLLGKNLSELKTVALTCGMPSFSAKQIADWIYKKRVTEISQMTNLSLNARAILEEKFQVGRTQPLSEESSVDSTKKYLFQAEHGLIETVFIPDEERATVCVSSQVGCKMNCVFCMTGKQGFSGNLSAAEILNQIFSIPETEQLTNMVLMGMGEPFDNTPSVLSALEALTSEWGCAWSPRRITVSTVGLIPGMKEFLEHSDCHLAVSLHHPLSENRQQLMPVERAYPISDVLNEIRKYNFKGQRRISFEYIILEGKNDTLRHARELVRLISDIPCRVNLIRFHSIPEVEFKSPSIKKIEEFRNYLTENNVICTIRRSRGEDISAACGLLSTSKKA